ncbi:hypothetical protein LPW41_11630 [Microbacterium sp. JC 701]|uniref:hypothetical protein n=1 Tax=Microbacterium sp. JC 701 TaxID=2897389 RepID=UPI001E2AD9AA|nr:hypothetical protein [Microbacterium sp. JC 701]MCD2170347.1 hypothetical protein [Microbacterium sp. JC 701]
MSEQNTTDGTVALPRPKIAQLEEWVRDFQDQGHVIAGSIRVLQQDTEESDDVGLVVITMQNTSASIYLESTGPAEVMWQATLTERHEEETVRPVNLINLGAEIVVAGNLCAYLQERTFGEATSGEA